MSIPTIILIGNFLSAKGGSRGPIEDLRDALLLRGRNVVYASTSKSRVRRLCEMLHVVLLQAPRWSVAIVDVYSGMAFIAALTAAVGLQFRRIPFILTLHGGALPAYAQQHPHLVAFVFRKAARITSPSPYLGRSFGTYADRMVTMPNPVDVSLHSMRATRHELRRILWLRSFHEIYNPMMALRTFGHVRKVFPDSSLTMVGPDKGDGSLDRCRAYAAATGFDAEVTFVMGIPKQAVPEIMSQHDVFINTTHVDNTPVTLIEAMASGLVVISTRVGGIPDLVTDGIHAHLVSDDDDHAMGDVLMKVMSDVNATREMTATARRHAEKFDINIVSKRWMELIDDVRLVPS